MADWQPIETAPKDGDDVLLWWSYPAEMISGFDVCHWDHEMWIISSECEHELAKHQGLYTHWMRPEPPNA